MNCDPLNATHMWKMSRWLMNDMIYAINTRKAGASSSKGIGQCIDTNISLHCNNLFPWSAV